MTMAETFLAVFAALVMNSAIGAAIRMTALHRMQARLRDELERNRPELDDLEDER